MTPDSHSDRRTVLKASGVALATGALAGCLAGGSGDSGGTTTDPDTATVAVGPNGNLRFDPPKLEVPPGTTVRWVWKSDNHNIVPKSQPDGANWTGTEGGKFDTYNRRHEYVHAFETTGTYDYSCYPHEGAGMVGTVVVSESATASTTHEGDADGHGEEDDTPDDETAEQETETATALHLPIEVAPDNRLEFSPSGDEPLVVEPGTEVGFVWRSDNHNVVVDDQPKGANWDGTPGGPETFYDEGYEYSHTFETTGTYEFHCEAHEPAGMTGTIVVREDVPTPSFATEADLPVRVGPSGEFVFSPGTDRPLKVPAGTEVRFVWDSDGHNIVMDDQPEAADWWGTPDTPSVTYDAGYEFSHTFDVPGVYEFHCQPHETLGMEGTIVVEEK